MKKNAFITAAALVCLVFAAAFFPAASAAQGLDECWSRVARVASRLSVATGAAPRIFVKDDPAQGAFVLPNGTVVITSGLVESAGSDDEVAFVIAHEVAHIMARDQAPDLTGTSDTTAAQPGEIRADAAALVFVKKAGYDPAASLDLLKRLSTGAVNLSPRIEAISTTLGR